eukprot:TRINITY_DN161_c2_g2_i1.p2 TRINITY_DN161_c2_g2~~TRINITY_DN161_c2_g2_i1.p2  ORF type:complete len:667 (+),score=142.56 TRINITY_DN161_c2_g2_i1:64-2001(+)
MAHVPAQAGRKRTNAEALHDPEVSPHKRVKLADVGELDVAEDVKQFLSGTSLMHKVWEEACLEVLDQEHAPVISVNQVRLREVLHKRMRQEKDRKEFLKSLLPFFLKEPVLRLCLRPMDDAGKLTAFPNSSIVRLFLSVDAIQARVMQQLIEVLPDYVNDDDGLTQNLPFEDDIPRVILSQFRWLDRVVEGVELSRRLFELFHICPHRLKKEIISMIPEIVDDSGHEIVVKELLDIVEQQEHEYLTTTFDALGNLSLAPEYQPTVLDSILKALRRAKLSDLPVIVRYILQTATPEDAKKVVGILRTDLRFDSVEVDCEESNQGAHEALVVDTLQSGIRFHLHFVKTFLAEIQACPDARDHTFLDLWFLVIIYSIGNYEKQIQQLLKKKVTKGHFTKGLLKGALGGHASALKQLFPDLLRFAGFLVSSSSPEMRSFGSEMYHLCFENFEDPFHRQELLGAIMAHVGSGSPGEVDTALGQLLRLSTNHHAVMVKYVSFINCMLDYLVRYSTEQARLAYEIFSLLCFNEEGEEAMGSSELLIIIRKQLANPEKTYRQLGIIGSVRVIGRLGSIVRGEEIGDGDFEIIEGLLENVVQHSRKDSGSLAFFMDELGKIVPNIKENRRLVLHICQYESRAPCSRAAHDPRFS